MSQLKFEIKHFWKESRKRAILPKKVIILSIEVIRICNCTFFHFYTTALALNATLWEERSCSKSQGAIFWYNIYIYFCKFILYSICVPPWNIFPNNDFNICPAFRNNIYFLLQKMHFRKTFCFVYTYNRNSNRTLTLFLKKNQSSSLNC